MRRYSCEETNPFQVHPATTQPVARKMLDGDRDLETAFASIVQCIKLEDGEGIPPAPSPPKSNGQRDDVFVGAGQGGGFGAIGDRPESVPFRRHARRTSVPDLLLDSAAPLTPVSTGSYHGRACPSSADDAIKLARLSTSSSMNSMNSTNSIGASSPTPIRLTERVLTPCPIKSFLDDDWLRDRVRRDSKMAQVAAGLVRNSPSPHASLAFSSPGTTTPASANKPAPDADYVCRLCGIPGHWIRDCALFEPANNNHANHSNSANNSNIMATIPPNGRPNNRGHLPPGNYVCRLCGIPGHWIEQCVKFQRKKDAPTHTSTAAFAKPPPDSYICNLCHQPGHWIQQCSEFTPHSTSSSTKRRF